MANLEQTDRWMAEQFQKHDYRMMYEIWNKFRAEQLSKSKGANKDLVYCCNCKKPHKLGVFINPASGNYFYSKPCPTATNIIKASKAWVDEDGYINVEVCNG